MSKLNKKIFINITENIHSKLVKFNSKKISKSEMNSQLIINICTIFKYLKVKEEKLSLKERKSFSSFKPKNTKTIRNLQTNR